HFILLSLVKTGSLESHRGQHGPGATPSPRFGFRHPDHSAAKPVFAHALGQEEDIDKQQAHRSPAEEPADYFLRRGIRDQNRKWTHITISRLLQVIRTETVPDRCLRTVAGCVGQRQPWLSFLHGHARSSSDACVSL